MGDWAEEWFELNPEDSDPGFLLHNWCTRYLAAELLPPRRVVVRFVFTDQPPKQHEMWVIFDRAESEVCLTDPGMEVDLEVTCPATALAQWHLGRLEWARAVRAGAIYVTGPRDLSRALPTWNQRSVWAT